MNIHHILKLKGERKTHIRSLNSSYASIQRSVLVLSSIMIVHAEFGANENEEREF